MGTFSLHAPLIHFSATMSIWHGSYSETRCMGEWACGVLYVKHTLINVEFCQVFQQRRSEGKCFTKEASGATLWKSTLIIFRDSCSIHNTCVCNSICLNVCNGCRYFSRGNEPYKEGFLAPPPIMASSLVRVVKRRGKWNAEGCRQAGEKRRGKRTDERLRERGGVNTGASWQREWQQGLNWRRRQKLRLPLTWVLHFVQVTILRHHLHTR